MGPVPGRPRSELSGTRRNQLRVRSVKPVDQSGAQLGGQCTDFLDFAVGHTTRALIVADIAFLAESIYLSDRLAVATQADALQPVA